MKKTWHFRHAMDGGEAVLENLHVQAQERLQENVKLVGIRHGNEMCTGVMSSEEAII